MKKLPILRLTICAGLLLGAAACSSGAPQGAPPPTAAGSDGGLVTLRGTIRAGAELGEIKAYCPEGLYLSADGGNLVNQTSLLLLRVPDESGQPRMLTDRQHLGQRVSVLGVYPAQEVFCEALICECEDYILVESITPADAAPPSSSE